MEVLGDARKSLRINRACCLPKRAISSGVSPFFINPREDVCSPLHFPELSDHPFGYLYTMRLEWAAQLLEQQAGPVSGIAYAVGFNDAEYFLKRFRQSLGIAPSEYTSNAF